MGSPVYEVQEGSKMELNGDDILEMEANERADKGIFLSFQTPLSLSGVKVYQLLQMALNGKKHPLEIRNKVKEVAAELKINEELLSRSLNEGASGG
jgi:Fe-S cluster assembly ATP-binding protein